MNDADIFAAIRARKGSDLTQSDVDTINRIMGVRAGRALANAEAFYVGVRKVTGSLDQLQVMIIEDLLKAASDWGVGWLAYGLATAWHESRMKPIEEWGKGKGREYGKVNATGKAPYGRGLVQLTWHANYVKADDELKLGGKLADNYDLALDPDIAVKIMVKGMEAGWFTGKALQDFIKSDLGTREEFRQARKIINGQDKADMIAGYAISFQSALGAGGWA